jgi:heme-degrading monooxygenase HmoA
MAIRVMVFAKIKEGEEEAFAKAYAEVTRKVKGTDGHVCDELLRNTQEPGSFILLSEWQSKEKFLAWEDAPIHMQTTTPMRPHWAGRVERVIYDVVHRIGDE